MALQFNAPDWLVKDYFENKRTPYQEASIGIQTALNNYLQIDEARRRNMLADQEMKNRQESNRIAAEQVRQSGIKDFVATGDPMLAPRDIQQAISSPVQGPMTESGAGPAEPPVVAWSKKLMADRERQRTLAEEKTRNDMNPNTLDEITAQQVRDGKITLEDAYKMKASGQMPSWQFIGTQNGQPVFLNPKTTETKSGSLPGAGPLTSTTQTEGQANAKLYASRTEEADRQINELSSKIDLTSVRSGAEGKLPNIAKSKEIQLFEQSKRNFLNAVLRRESGAVISPSEFAEGNKQYFPVMGDSPEVLEQKRLNRQTAIAGLQNAAGGSPSNQPARPSGIPQAGGVFDGKRIKNVTRVQ